MRLACAEYTFPLLPRQACYRLIADLGFQAVDIAAFASGPVARLEQVLDNPRGAADRILTDLREVGLSVSDVMATYGKASYGDAAVNTPRAEDRALLRRQFERLTELARRLESPGLTILPGVAWPGEPLEESLVRAAEELQWRAEQAERAGLRLSVEPHVGSLIATPSATLRLLDLAPSLRLTLDYAHFVYAGVPDTDVDVLLGRTRHIQLRQASAGVMQARVREGSIDLGRVIEAAERDGYDGYWGLEYVWIDAWDCTRVDNLSETILLRDHLLGLAGLRAAVRGRDQVDGTRA